MSDENNREEEKKATTGKVIVCPHCETRIVVQFSVDICGWKVEKPGASPAKHIDPWLRTLNPSQIAALDGAKRSGLFESFEYALKSSAAIRPPKNMEKFFLQWFQMCRANSIPSWALNEFRELYPGKLIEFFSHGGVGGVVAGGAISLFVPMQILSGTRVEMAGGVDTKIPADVKGVQQWIKTKMGYVPSGARVALSVMRARCVGEFARPAI